MHEDDVAVLRALLAIDSLKEDERDAFFDMLQQLELSTKLVLSEKQRIWARGRADELDVVWWNPTTRNAGVPRGEEVLPAWNTNLPKAPPRRHG